MSLMEGIFGSPDSQADYEAYMAQQAMQGSILGQQYNQVIGQAIQNQKRPKPMPRFNPNESEAFQIPMSQLVTMWRLKHGEEWVDMQRVRPPSGKDFYTDALDRLDRASKLEMFDGWCRLKEDA